MSLAGRSAIVTGGGRGIGRGIALALAQAGADVAINYRRDEAAAQEVAAEVQRMGRKCFAMRCDVTDQAAVREMVARSVEALGKLDLLVNNAGIVSRGNFIADTEVEDMRRVIDTHIFGAFYMTKEALPHLRKNPRGDIHFISSASPHLAPKGHGPYATAKAGMEAMARVLAREEMANNIRVNVIAAGVVETEMGRRLVRFNWGEELAESRHLFPFGRPCQPEDVGNLCVFLASQAGGYMSGHVIFLDGGDTPGVAKRE